MNKVIEVENKVYIPTYVKEIFSCTKCDLDDKKSRRCKLLARYNYRAACPLVKTSHLTYKEAKGGI